MFHANFELNAFNCFGKEVDFVIVAILCNGDHLGYST